MRAIKNEIESIISYFVDSLDIPDSAKDEIDISRLSTEINNYLEKHKTYYSENGKVCFSCGRIEGSWSSNKFGTVLEDSLKHNYEIYVF